MITVIRIICWTSAAALAALTVAMIQDSKTEAGQAMPIDGLFTLILGFSSFFFALFGWFL